MKDKTLPFIYRSFFNYWMVLILPISIAITVITNLYYNGGIQLEALKELGTWKNLVVYQVFLSFFLYIWEFTPKVKRLKEGQNKPN